MEQFERAENDERDCLSESISRDLVSPQGTPQRPSPNPDTAQTVPCQPSRQAHTHPAAGNLKGGGEGGRAGRAGGREAGNTSSVKEENHRQVKKPLHAVTGTLWVKKVGEVKKR